MFRAVIMLMLFFISFTGYTQEEKSLSYAEQLKALESEIDSLSVFNLIESIISLENVSSELNIHFGFTSSVTSVGRDYNIDQQGFSPGLSYFHKSGIYSDISGYWNSDIEPNYNPTIFSLGYLHSINDKWSYSLDYERWFFNPQDTSESPLKNSLGGSLSRDIDIVNIGLDYSILFGRETAHRIIGNLGSTINLGKWWIFNDINLYPTASIIFGNSDITQLIINERILSESNAARIANITTFENYTENQIQLIQGIIWNAFNNGIISEEERRRLNFKARNSQALNEREIDTMQKIASGSFQSSTFEISNEFGILNYSFMLPLAVSIENLSLVLSYTYSIPVELPGEFFEVDPVGFFGASLSYRIPFK